MGRGDAVVDRPGLGTHGGIVLKAALGDISKIKMKFDAVVHTVGPVGVRATRMARRRSCRRVALAGR